VHYLDNKEFDIINARCNHEKYSNVLYLLFIIDMMHRMFVAMAADG
jgi:hypothetical protein